MKLLFYISSLKGGGSERVLQLLANELVNRGNEVAVCTNLNLPFAYHLDKKIGLFDLNVPEKKFRRIGFLKNIRQVANNYNPDVVITFMAGLNRYVIMSLLYSGYPVIASEHSIFLSYRESRLISYIERYFINKLAKRVTVLTQRDYNFIGRRLSNKVVMPNPLSFKAVDTFDEKSKEKSILLCGSLTRGKDKGFDKMIILWSDICNKYPEWTLQIAGSGDNCSIEYFKSLIKEYKVENNVKLLGFQHDISKVMFKSSIFIISSQSEGFSMALIEAMSQGCACLSFDCEAGPREIISKDNSDGILVEDQNWEKMKEELEILIDNPDLRRRLAQKAIKSVKRFDLSSIVTKWEELFSEVVS